ncbi:histone deacetylase [Inhella sp.]|uniref:histone deacetylase family protein n=1 Tax=Inhella sp. TaxID=1921806 RepID=UPI0035B09AC2
MLAFHADTTPLQLPSTHRFPHHKYAALRERLGERLPQLRLRAARMAPVPDVLRVHDAGYVQRVLDGSLSTAEQREIGFPWSPAMPLRARRSVGATLAATDAALREGVAMNLGGGTHHASRDKGGGFCVFNDVAVAARRAQARKQVRRVLVVDLDVHQGNGSAALFAGDPDVFTLSLHGARNFPFRKVASSLDVDLPDACGDADYLAALDAALAEVAQRFEGPELAFYLAGADPHEGDRLGRLKLSAAGLAARDERVFAWLLARRVPTVMLMAGGYPTDLEALLQVQQASAEAALTAWTQWKNAATAAEPQ